MKYLKYFSVNENLTDIVYHYIKNPSFLTSILINDEFRLNFSVVNSSDVHDRGNKKLWYFSTTRSLTGIYHRNNYYQILLELDGRLLSHNYKSIPFNYYKSDKTLDMEESEDRIISDKSVIKNATKYIKAIHISNPDIDKYNIGTWKNIKKLIEEKNIPLYLYENEDSNIARKDLITKNFKKAKRKFDLSMYDDFNDNDSDETEFDINNLAEYDRKIIDAIKLIFKYIETRDMSDLKKIITDGHDLRDYYIKASKDSFLAKLDGYIHRVIYLYRNFKSEELNDLMNKIAKHMSKKGYGKLSDISDEIYNEIKKGAVSNPFLFKF